MDKADLLKAEYLHLQSVVESFDQRSLTIKAWSVSLAAGVGALGAEHEESLLVIAGSALMFWLIEGYWKSFQDAYYTRTRELEAFFAGEIADVVPMQIGRSWYKAWRKGGRKRLMRIMRWPHVALPHVVVVIVSLVIYFIRLAA
ncbi:MAG TPA: hypothetical protein VK610_09755 [Rhodothermales bacterium]|nr:hypothetical protein [Rhodothermales bacterium]